MSILVHNSLGQLVRVLDLGVQSRGQYCDSQRAAYWDGRSDAGEPIPSGVYFYTVRTADFSLTRKLVMLR